MGGGSWACQVRHAASPGPFVTATRLSRAKSVVACARASRELVLADVGECAELLVEIGTGVGRDDRKTSLLSSQNRLIPDFFALDSSLRSGVFVTSADLDATRLSSLLSA